MKPVLRPLYTSPRYLELSHARSLASCMTSRNASTAFASAGFKARVLPSKTTSGSSIFSSASSMAWTRSCSWCVSGSA